MGTLPRYLAHITKGHLRGMWEGQSNCQMTHQKFHNTPKDTQNICTMLILLELEN